MVMNTRLGTLFNMQLLAFIYMRQGRIQAASELQNRDLMATSRVYGQSHPRTIEAWIKFQRSNRFSRDRPLTFFLPPSTCTS